jgi:hypothetical protein
VQQKKTQQPTTIVRIHKSQTSNRLKHTTQVIHVILSFQFSSVKTIIDTLDLDATIWNLVPNANTK